MHYRGSVFLAAWLLAGAAAAQAVPAASAAGVHWTLQQPAPDTVDYRRRAPLVTEAVESPFRFRDPNEGGPLNVPPPSAMDRAAVMGAERAWSDGRPPLDCARTPMDAACH
jgi:hypothetical protein